MNRNKGLVDLLILGILALVALVAAGYFLFSQSFMAPVTNLSKQIGLPFAIPTNVNDITTLEKDINTTEFNSIDSDLTNLEKELNSSLTE